MSLLKTLLKIPCSEISDLSVGDEIYCKIGKIYKTKIDSITTHVQDPYVRSNELGDITYERCWKITKSLKARILLEGENSDNYSDQ